MWRTVLLKTTVQTRLTSRWLVVLEGAAIGVCLTRAGVTDWVPMVVRLGWCVSVMVVL